MKYLGIDFGSKRIGLALSDEGNTFALPHKVIPNSKDLSEVVIHEIKQNNVVHIVIGDSKNYAGLDNPIMNSTRSFVEDLKSKTNIPISFEPEFMTSAHAEKTQGRHDLLDASSAALILQSYLDRLKNGGLTTGV